MGVNYVADCSPVANLFGTDRPYNFIYLPY